MTTDIALAIVGGGPAPMAAARGFRDAGGAGTVALVAEEGREPYRRPPLTKEFPRGGPPLASLRTAAAVD